MTTALVPLKPHASASAPTTDSAEYRVGLPSDRVLTRREILDRLADLSVEALVGGNTALAYVLDRVLIACNGARGMDLATDMLLFLEREQLLEVVQEPNGWIRPRDFLDELSPTGVFTVVP